MTILLPLAFALVLAQSPTAVPSESSLARARALYDAAAYEEALSMLIAMEETESLEKIEEYRALCFLALGRPADAERALTRIVQQSPTYVMDGDEVSPRLIVIFNKVRDSLLPEIARNLYRRANASLAIFEYGTASAQFRELVAVLSSFQPGVNDMNEMIDLRRRAEGLVAASEQVYSVSDPFVTPPIEVSRYIPRWVDRYETGRTGLYQGVIEVLIDATGRVKSATMPRGITRGFDASLIESTKNWRFQPATFRGLPVSYKKTFEVIVRAR